MQLSEANKKIISDEFRVIVQLINEEEDALRRVYYFSAAYGVVHRVINSEFNNELTLMHSVLHNTYLALDSRLKSIISGGERVIELPSNALSVLSSALNELCDVISKDQDIYEPLAKIAAISYVTTGNGYYLYRKGVLRLE